MAARVYALEEELKAVRAELVEVQAECRSRSPPDNTADLPAKKKAKHASVEYVVDETHRSIVTVRTSVMYIHCHPGVLTSVT